MATPESKVKAGIKKFLNSLLGCWWFMPATGGFGKSGVPDFIICKAVVVTPEMVGTVVGKFYAIEAKAPGGRLTELQKGQIEEINGAGGCAVVCYDAAELEAIL